MFTSTFAGLTICCSCWFGCCKPAYQPHYAPPGYVYPGAYYGPGAVSPQPYPGTVVVPHPGGAAIEKKAMPTVPPTVEVKPPTIKPETKLKEKTLYDRLGGEGAIKAVVDDFVGRAAADPKVNFTRKGTSKEWKATPENVDRLKKMLVELVGMVTGGPQKYSGHNMKEAHAGMKITQAEFDAAAADLKATLDKFKVPAKEQNELLKIVGSTAPDIVEKSDK